MSINKLLPVLLLRSAAYWCELEKIVHLLGKSTKFSYTIGRNPHHKGQDPLMEGLLYERERKRNSVGKN